MMLCNRLTGLAAASVALGWLGWAPQSRANIVEILPALHDESVDGDLSSSPATPTSLGVLQAGSDDFLNLVAGSVNSLDGVNGAGSDTRDYFSFTVGAGQSLAAIELLSYDDPTTPEFNDGNRGFYALFGPGDTVANPSGVGVNAGIGGNHLDPPALEVFTATDLIAAAFVGVGLGENLLPAIAGGGISGGSGFDAGAGLGPGTYTLLVQQTGRVTSQYELNLQVVPEPASLALLALGGLALGNARRRAR